MIGRAQLERLWGNLAGLGARRLAALGIIGLTIFASVGLGSYYLSRPELETLYGGLNAQDISRIGAALSEAGIPFDVDSAGTKVLVPYSQTAQARMLLAEKGLPSSANAGYELFDKLGPMGLTSFMQEITRVRALEGEIARTIQAIKGVKAARVHIVLPDGGSFRRNRQPPSASVVVRTDVPGDGSAARAIRHLVAAAVPELTIDQVSVLSTDGTVLASGGDSFDGAPAKMVELEKTISKSLQDNVRKTLAPYLGAENFEISVTARLNVDKRQINETAYDPQSRVERSLRVVKETENSQNQSNRTTVGVEQNVPAEEVNARPGDQSRRANERREELTNYELNTKTITTVSEGYKIDNLTVAVVINRKRLAESLGDGAGPEAIDRQLKEVERLVATAAGVDQRRGDQISVAALEFHKDGQTLDPYPSPGILEHIVRQTGSIVRAAAILGATLLLVWFGLRPALRVILDQPAPAEVPSGGPLAVEAAASGQQLAGATPPSLATSSDEPNLLADLTAQSNRSPQRRLEQLIEAHEEQAAVILKQWLRGAQGT